MGSAKIDLTQLELGKAEDINLSLSDTNNGEPGLSMGEILINLTLWPRSQEDKEMVSQIYDTIRYNTIRWDYDWICARLRKEVQCQLQRHTRCIT